MENKLKKVLSSLETSELDELLDSELKIKQDSINTESVFVLVGEKTGLRPKKQMIRKGLRRVLIACLILVAVSLLAVGCAEVKEYNDAVAFFDEKHLDAEGLTWSEIKAVYRDIKMETFTYDLTADVIKNSIIKLNLKGYELGSSVLPTLSPLEVNKLWREYVEKQSEIKKNGVICEKLQNEEDGGSTAVEVKKYNDGQLVWTTCVYDIQWFFNDIVIVSDGILLRGQVRESEFGKTTGKLVKIDNEGNILWETLLEDHYFNSFGDIIETSDGSYVLFDSKGKKIIRKTVSKNGELTSTTEIEQDDHIRLKKVIKAREYTFLHVSIEEKNIYSKIIKLNSDGKVVEQYTLKSETEQYFIEDMIEYNGKIYISATTVPRVENDETEYVGRYYIDGLLKDAFSEDKNGIDLTADYLTKARQIYKAVLLQCDVEKMIPSQFMSTKCSVGGELSLNKNGELIWDLYEIINVNYSPYTSSFTFGFTGSVIRFNINEKGKVTSKTKTDELEQWSY